MTPQPSEDGAHITTPTRDATDRAPSAPSGIHAHSGFSYREFERRWAAVLARVEADGLDALLVTSKTNLEYLTGHDAGGTYATPYVLVVAPGHPRTFLVRAYDEISVRREAVPLELRTFFGASDAMRSAADVVRSFGLARSRLGIEMDHWGLAPGDLLALEHHLPEARFENASRVVASVAERKSAEELAVMRAAMRLTEVAVATFWGQVRGGVSEIEARHAVWSAVEVAGGAMRDNDFELRFGPRTALPRGRSDGYRLRDGDVAFVETSGYVHDYAAGLCRTAVLGRNPDAEALHRIAEDCTDAAIEALRPGATGDEVHRAVRRVVEGAGRGSTMTQRTGYAIGLNWHVRGYMSLEPGAVEPIEAGMTFHTPRILFDERERFAVGTSETILVTDHGADVMSTLPRTLHLA